MYYTFHEWRDLKCSNILRNFIFHPLFLPIIGSHNCRCFSRWPFPPSRADTRWHRTCKCRQSGSRWRMTGPRYFFFHLPSLLLSARSRLDPSHRLLRDGIRDEHSPQLFLSGADYRKSMVFRKWRVKCGKCNNVGNMPLRRGWSWPEQNGRSAGQSGLAERRWGRYVR